MADLTITVANVSLAANGVQLKTVQVGEAVTQGEPLYLKSADNKYWSTDSDAEESAQAKGIALTKASADGYAVLATSGPIDVGATLTVGETYCVSTNAGGIAPIADLTTGDFVTILGVATTASKLELDIYTSGVAKP